jgi:hypothetical protein
MQITQYLSFFLKAWYQSTLYLKVNKVEEELQAAAFLSMVGPKTYTLIKSLLTPEKPEKQSLTELTTVLQNHYSPVPLEIVERFKFQKRTQKQGESCAQYLASLKELSATCNFGAGLSDRLRDQFVCGLHMSHESIQKKLLTESGLTLDSALKIAKGMETAAHDVKEISAQSHNSSNVHKMNVTPTSLRVKEILNRRHSHMW